MTVKVGQIREFNNYMIAISHIGYTISLGDVATIIYEDGLAGDNSCNFLEKNSKLIAEYPTWQQAVNSPEFKGE